MKYYPVRGLGLFRKEEEEEVTIDYKELLLKGSSRKAKSDSSDDGVIDAGAGVGAEVGAGAEAEAGSVIEAEA